MKNNYNLIWIDMEMTGLKPESDVIIEIATIVTDPHLNIIGQGPVLAIKQPLSTIEAMDSWNTRQHGGSGLVDRVLASDITEAEAERQTLEFLRPYIDSNCSPICGNGICQDRRFLYNYMPKLEAYFHYRNLDVSSLKELVKRWQPNLLNGIVKQSKHLALDDIIDSIEELRYYRAHFIKSTDSN